MIPSIRHLMQRSQRTVAVGFTSRLLFLVDGSGDGSRLERLSVAQFAHALPPAAESERRRVELVDGLRRALGAREAGGVNAVLALRQLDLKTRCARLPATDSAEIAQMADFEISKAIPFDDRPHLKRFTALREHGIEGADVMMYAVDAAVLDDYIRAFHRVRLPLGRTVAAGLALHEAARRHPPHFETDDPAAAALADPDAPRLLLYLGLDGADLVLVKGGIPMFMRSATATALTRLQAKLLMGSVPFRLEDIARVDLADPLASLGAIAQRNEHLRDAPPEIEAESVTGVWMGLPDQALADWIVRIEREVRRTLEFARAEAGIDGVRRIDLAGPGALAGHLAERLAADLHMPVVLLGDEFDRAMGKVEVSVAADGARPGADGTAAVQAAATPDDLDAAFYRAVAVPAWGAMLYAAEAATTTDDLTPDWYYREQSATTRRRSLVTSGLLFGLLLLLVGLYLAVDTHHRNEYLDAVRADNARMRPIAAQLESKKEKLEIVRRVVADKFSALAVVDLLSSLDVLREGRASLRTVDFVRGGELVVGGHAKTLGDILELERALKGHGEFFTAVINRGQGPTTLNGKDIYEFSFQCNLRAIVQREGADGGARPFAARGGVTTVRR